MKQAQVFFASINIKMGIHVCTICSKTFKQKGHLTTHTNRKVPCVKNNIIEEIIEVEPVLIQDNQIDYSRKTIAELVALCKERKIKGYSGKSKNAIVALFQTEPAQNVIVDSNNYKVISLFSGMGGMDVGFAEQVIVHKNSVQSDYIETPYPSIDGFVNLKRLPFTTVLQNDILPEAKLVSELNNWNHNFQLKDIRDLLKDNYAFPEADVITGGFPCQDFSHAGKRQGFDATRGTLYQSYVELVKRVKPTIFVAENVNGLLTMPGNPITKIIADFTAVGYEVKYQLIKCEEYGIPQTRWRVIIMGIRIDKKKNLAEDWNIISENKLTCHIRHYFKHLQEPSISSDPAQQAYSKAARLEKGQGQKEVGLDEFAPTMRAEHHGNIEFRRVNGGKNEKDLAERRLTVREAALIQTFPPDCKLTEPNKVSGKAYKPIGNAVPPLLGYIIARKVYQLLKKIES